MKKRRISLTPEEENKALDDLVDSAKKCAVLNNYLKPFHWYLTPFFYTDQFKLIQDMMDTNSGTKRGIMETMKLTMFDTRMMAIYMEAFYKKLPHLSQFSFLIDQGIVLYLQHDYAGAITTMVPIVEGVIRSYLKTKGNLDPSFADLKNSFDLMQADILDYNKEIYIAEGFDEATYLPLMLKQEEFIGTWMGFIKDFIINGLYMNTKSGGLPGDFLNRHLVSHLLTDDIYYNYSNVMKTYIAIQYLAWIFIQMTEDFGIAPNIEKKEYHERDLAYEEINRIASDRLAVLKDRLYRGHPTYTIEDYFQ